MKQSALCAVYDKELESFLPIFQAPTVATAVRALQDEVNTPNSQFSRHPESYELYQLATVDPDQGRITPLETKRLIIRVSELKAS